MAQTSLLRESHTLGLPFDSFDEFFGQPTPLDGQSSHFLLGSECFKPRVLFVESRPRRQRPSCKAPSLTTLKTIREVAICSSSAPPFSAETCALSCELSWVAPPRCGCTWQQIYYIWLVRSSSREGPTRGRRSDPPSSRLCGASRAAQESAIFIPTLSKVRPGRWAPLQVRVRLNGGDLAKAEVTNEVVEEM
jgi:hypothetical protein